LAVLGGSLIGLYLLHKAARLVLWIGLGA